MKHEELRLKTNDGLDLYAQRWMPWGGLKGVVCLVHGLGEYSTRYRHWAERMTGAGYALMAFDLRGHGRSKGERGHAPTFDHLADDVSVFLEKAPELFEDLPCFLYGHSLGGIIVLYYLLQRQPRLNGAIVTSPGLQNSIQKQRLKVVMARVLGTVAPKGTMASGLEQKALSRDQAVVEAYRNDPIVHDRISFSLGKEGLQAISYIFGTAARLEGPLLLMHGTADRIAYSSGSEKLAGLVGNRCTLKLWEGLYHELHNEPEKDEIFDYLRHWLDEKVSG